MKATEARLWNLIYKEVRELDEANYTRVETGHIREGVADIEYVHYPWHGWIELKVADLPKLDKPIRLRTDYTLDQLTWLVRHHDPGIWLRSWLLVGFAKVTSWDHFLILPPKASINLVKGRARLDYKRLIRLPGVTRCRTIQEIVDEVKGV